MIAGIRLAARSRVVWVEVGDADLRAGMACLIADPDGVYEGEVTVSPSQLLRLPEPSGQYALVGPVEDLGVTRLALLTADRPRVANLAAERVRIAAGATHAFLRDTPSEEAAGALSEALGVPVFPRDASGERPQPPIPDLLAEVRLAGETYIVESVSAFRDVIRLRARDGRVSERRLEEIRGLEP